MSDDEKVGYGKPPKHTRFKKGQSGNPTGRPKGRHNFGRDLRDTLNAQVMLKQNGRAMKVSTQQAALLRLREKALGGDPRALDRVLELASKHNDAALLDDTKAALGANDQAIVDGFAERVRRREAKVQESGTNPATNNLDDEDER